MAESSRTRHSPQFSDGENEASVEVRFSSSGQRWSWSAAPPAPAPALSAVSWLLAGTAKVTFPSWGGVSLEYLVYKWQRALFRRSRNGPFSKVAVLGRIRWDLRPLFWRHFLPTIGRKPMRTLPCFSHLLCLSVPSKGNSPLGSLGLVQRDLVLFHQTQPYST